MGNLNIQWFLINDDDNDMNIDASKVASVTQNGMK